MLPVQFSAVSPNLIFPLTFFPGEPLSPFCPWNRQKEETMKEWGPLVSLFFVIASALIVYSLLKYWKNKASEAE